jgi:hypothetical protein
MEKLSAYLNREYADFRSPAHFVILHGRDVIQIMSGQPLPGEGESVIGRIPEEMETVSIDGFVFSPSDGDYSVAYIGTEAEIFPVREAIQRMYDMISCIRRLVA